MTNGAAQAIRLDKQRERVHILKFDNNGAFAIVTSCSEPDDFLSETSSVMEDMLTDLAGDTQFTIIGLLPLICEIWAKLKGYKSERVKEYTIMSVGDHTPGEVAMMEWPRTAGRVACNQQQTMVCPGCGHTKE
mgnify:FL=1